MSDRFLRVDTVEASTSLGPVRLPVLYADATSVQAFFWVDPALARRALEGTGLEPLRLPGGRALAGLAFYDYRETSIGPYHEVGSGLAVVPAGAPASGLAALELLRAGRKRRAGYRILDLPVSTPLADVAGRELWGYPKFVTELPLRVEERAFEGAVLEPGGTSPVLTLSGEARWRWPGLPLDLVLYSHLGGRVLRAVVDASGPVRFSGGRGLRLALGPGRHRMAEALRALGLDGAHPFAAARCDRLRARLWAGQPAG